MFAVIWEVQGEAHRCPIGDTSKPQSLGKWIMTLSESDSSSHRAGDFIFGESVGEWFSYPWLQMIDVLIIC